MKKLISIICIIAIAVGAFFAGKLYAEQKADVTDTTESTSHKTDSDSIVSETPETPEIPETPDTSVDMADVIKAYEEEIKLYEDNLGEDETWLNNYALHDFDKDGVPELILHTGASEANRKYSICRYYNNYIEFVTEVDGWHGCVYKSNLSDGIVVALTGSAPENKTALHLTEVKVTARGYSGEIICNDALNDEEYNKVIEKHCGDMLEFSEDNSTSYLYEKLK